MEWFVRQSMEGGRCTALIEKNKSDSKKTLKVHQKN